MIIPGCVSLGKMQIVNLQAAAIMSGSAEPEQYAVRVQSRCEGPVDSCCPDRAVIVKLEKAESYPALY